MSRDHEDPLGGWMSLVERSQATLDRSRALSDMAHQTLRDAQRAQDRDQVRRVERQVLRELVEREYGSGPPPEA